MNILYLGNSDKISSKIGNSGKFNLVLLSENDELPLDKTFDLIFVNLSISLTNQGSQNTDKYLESINKIRSTYNNSVIINTTIMIPGTNQTLNTNFLYLTNNQWFLGLIGENNRILLDNFVKIIEERDNIQESIYYLDLKEVELLAYFNLYKKSIEISYYNEINDYCKKKNIDFTKIEQFTSRENDNPESFSIKEILTFANDIDTHKSSNYLTDSLINRFINHDHTQVDWLPIDESFDEEQQKEVLKNQTLSQLNLISQQNNIDISDCIERCHVVDKIINHKKKQSFDIKYFNRNQIQNQPVLNPAQQPVLNPSQQTIPRSAPQRQSGVPIQINQPTVNLRQPFNMNVRTNNGNGFMNLRPGSSNGQGQGGIRFGGGVQTVGR